MAYDPEKSVKGVVMLRRLLASVFIAAFPVVVVPIAVTSTDAAAGAAPPTAVQRCGNGGWMKFTDASEQLFATQGECIAYLIHHPVSLTDLSGSFSGTTVVGSKNCSLIEQAFDATYPGSSAVGSVTLHIDGCVDIFSKTYTGTFTITTGVGRLEGAVSGALSSLIFPPPIVFDLTLTVQSGTGAFSGTTGTMTASIQWDIGTSVTGSLAVP